jgi:putative ABC transport system permease protein
MEAFLPFRQLPSPRVNILLHAPGAGPGLSNQVRAAVAAVDPMLALSSYRSFEEIHATSMSRDRLLLTLIGGFAALALLLATVGVYGVTAAAVRRRTREFGIRLALGAGPGSLVRLVVGQGFRLTAFGVGLGLGGAFVAVRLLASVLHEVDPHDVLTFAVVPAVLAAAGLAACAIPALRAGRLDPAGPLRAE